MPRGSPAVPEDWPRGMLSALPLQQPLQLWRDVDSAGAALAGVLMLGQGDGFTFPVDRLGGELGEFGEGAGASQFQAEQEVGNIGLDGCHDLPALVGGDVAL